MADLNYRIRASRNIKAMADAIDPTLWGFIANTPNVTRDYTAAQIEEVASTPASVNGRISATLGRVFVRYETPEAVVPQMRLELSGDLARKGSVDEIRHTFLHEVAHVLDKMVPRTQSRRTAKRQPHGPEWRKLARALGLSGERTASVGYATRRRALKIVGQCERCGDRVKRATRLRNHLRYTHTTNGCGGRIQPRR